MVAFRAFQGIDFVDLLDEPGSVGLGRVVGRCLVQVQGSGGVGAAGFGVALVAGAVAVLPVVAHEVLVLVGDVRQ